ncbi:hypothetical protein M758_UG035100 [Ceratodon purpureus]|nr:hypothetical protein M758_UG035100 [Ceratodon purpureus]
MRHCRALFQALSHWMRLPLGGRSGPKSFVPSGTVVWKAGRRPEGGVEFFGGSYDRVGAQRMLRRFDFRGVANPTVALPIGLVTPASDWETFRHGGMPRGETADEKLGE